MAYWQVAGMPKEVAPFTGAWIEITGMRPPGPSMRVAPFTGAWIEIPYILLSFPGTDVAPFTGAWIEISISFTESAYKSSLPSRERGLKFCGILFGRQEIRSLPSRERGLKCPYHTPGL